MLFSYNNCGDIRLAAIVPTESIVSTESPPTYLNPPATVTKNMRLVVFVDMSNSMISGPCRDDANTPWSDDPPPETPTCNAAQASDPDMYRLKVVKKWLLDFQSSMDAETLAKLKIMIVPFTGGKAETQREIAALDAHMNFADTATALNYVDALMQEQQDNKNYIFPPPNTAPVPPANGVTMGTSVPGTRLITIQDFITQEMATLRTQNQLDNADFQLVYISDGFPIPSIQNMKDFFTRIWKAKSVGATGAGNFNSCVNSCQPLINNLLNPASGVAWPVIGFACASDGGGDASYQGCSARCLCALYNYQQIGTGTSPQGSNGVLFNDVRANWGNFDDNRPLDILEEILRIKTIFMQNSEASYKFHFLYMQKGADYDAVNPAENWIKLAKGIFTKNANYDRIVSSELNVALFPGTLSSNSYQLQELFAVNLNAHVDKYGAIAIDSDGDGSFDYEDSHSDLARNNGFCLDSIVATYGCITQGCDPNLDIDGDGLNQCEEITLGTDPYDFDTSGDGIPDGLKVLFALNPLQNAKNAISNPSSPMTNFQKFSIGLNANLDPSAIDDVHKVSMALNFYDYKMTQVNGHSLAMAGYVAKLNNMPLVNTLASSGSLSLYRSSVHSTATQNTQIIVGGNHAAGINRVLFIGKVQSVTNPGDAYWIYKEVPITFNHGSQVIDLDLATFQQMRTKDPMGLHE